MAENYPNLAQCIHIQNTEQTPKRNSKNSAITHILVRLLKTKGKEKNLQSSNRQMMPYLQGKNNSNDRISHQKPRGLVGSGTTFFRC